MGALNPQSHRHSPGGTELTRRRAAACHRVCHARQHAALAQCYRLHHAGRSPGRSITNDLGDATCAARSGTRRTLSRASGRRRVTSPPLRITTPIVRPPTCHICAQPAHVHGQQFRAQPACVSSQWLNSRPEPASMRRVLSFFSIIGRLKPGWTRSGEFGPCRCGRCIGNRMRQLCPAFWPGAIPDAGRFCLERYRVQRETRRSIARGQGPCATQDQ